MTDTASPPIRRALISVSDKTGLADLGRFLEGRGVEILSTGGSARALSEAGVTVTEIADYTGFPEMMDGRVKTLHPKVHGGLLALREEAAHREAMAEHGIGAIDLLVVNLYPFEETVARGTAFAECVENIDIGGPAMIRSASKNHGAVTVIVDPDDYARLEEDMEANKGATSPELRRELAAKAFARTAAYDSAIAAWFAKETGEDFPARMSLAFERREILRYGENPHQEAAFYTGGPPRPGVAGATQLQGKALSYNNINDTDAAFELVAEIGGEHAAVAIIKHANPCGAAQAATLAEAYRKAQACDPTSAFGGIVALNRPIDAECAREIIQIFTEVVIAPEADAEAREIFAAKKNLRLLIAGGLPDPAAPGLTLRSVAGGYLLQGRDAGQVPKAELKVVTKRAPSEAEMRDMVFAFTVAKYVKSNAIVFARDGATVGIGAGQMSRVDAVRLGAQKARDAGTPLDNSVAASDAFFPFADGLVAAAEAGARAIIQPGGSVRDDEVIAAADDAGLAMVFTGMRHFRH